MSMILFDWLRKLAGARFGNPNGHVEGRGRWPHGTKSGPGRRPVDVAGQQRLRRATGPGSMHCETEIQRLVYANQFQDAYDLATRHWNQFNTPIKAVRKWLPATVKMVAEHHGTAVN